MKQEERRTRRTHLTGRAAILAVVVCAIVLSLAYPLREYLAQRSRIAELRADNSRMEQQIASLEAKKQRLNQPEYIKQRARERLHFHMPGQRNYIVVDRADADAEGDIEASAQAQQHPWFVNLWRSVEKADQKSGS